MLGAMMGGGMSASSAASASQDSANNVSSGTIKVNFKQNCILIH
jgi:hypothetical protein